MFLNNKKFVSGIVLSLGTIWIYLNIFWTQFYIFSQAIYEPWLFLRGFVLFRDIMWNRAGFELYLIAGFYKLLGVSPLNFQIFIFLIQSLIGVVMFLLLCKKSFWLAISSYILYVSFAFLIYGTIDESAEMLIGLFVFLVFYFYWEFIDKKNPKFLFFAGIATGFSLITKQTSLFIPFSVLLLLVIFSRRKLIKESMFYLSGTLVPVLAYAGYFAYNNGLYDLYFNTIYAPLFPYRQNAPLWGLSEGIKIMGLHLAILIPFIFMKTDRIFPKPVKTALILFVLSLFTTLLPTFWSYRLISALPIFSVMICTFFANEYLAFRKNKNYSTKAIVVFGIVAFLLQLSFYLNQSLKYIAVDSGGFAPQKYTLDGYSSTEENITRWLKNNTQKEEKVFNMATNFVMFYSEKLPQNKFDQSMYFGFYPLGQYYETITKNPARVVVLDTNLPKEWKILKNWKYLQFLKEHYELVKSFDQYQIYVLKRD